MSNLILVPPFPLVEPVTVTELQRHLRFDETSVEVVPTAPSVALSAAGAGNVDVGVHRYCCTFVTADGETNTGAVSTPVTVVDGAVHGQVQVTAIPLGGVLTIARRLYRSLAVDATVFFLVDELVDNVTTSYLDNIADADLGAGVPLTNTTLSAELQDLIVVARREAEEFLDRALITQHWTMQLDAFPSHEFLEVPRPNLLVGGAITYIDTSGATQTFDASNYTIDVRSLPGRVILNYGHYWPFTRSQRNCVSFGFTAGYGPAASDVPAEIRHAIKLRAADLYENRSPAPFDRLDTVKALLWPHRYMHV